MEQGVDSAARKLTSFSLRNPYPGCTIVTLRSLHMSIRCSWSMYDGTSTLSVARKTCGADESASV